MKVLSEQQKVELNTLLYRLQLDQEEQLLKLQKVSNDSHIGTMKRFENKLGHPRNSMLRKKLYCQKYSHY